MPFPGEKDKPNAQVYRLVVKGPSGISLSEFLEGERDCLEAAVFLKCTTSKISIYWSLFYPVSSSFFLPQNGRTSGYLDQGSSSRAVTKRST